MHEFSIARSIVNIAEEEVRKAGAKVVEEIELDIGELSGIEMDSLEFVWDAAVKGTVLNNAKRLVNKIDGRAKCQNCKTEFEMHQLFDACPKCNNYFNSILSGKELKIKSITINK